MLLKKPAQVPHSKPKLLRFNPIPKRINAEGRSSCPKLLPIRKNHKKIFLKIKNQKKYGDGYMPRLLLPGQKFSKS